MLHEFIAAHRDLNHFAYEGTGVGAGRGRLSQAARGRDTLAPTRGITLVG